MILNEIDDTSKKLGNEDKLLVERKDKEKLNGIELDSNKGKSYSNEGKSYSKDKLYCWRRKFARK